MTTTGHGPEPVDVRAGLDVGDRIAVVGLQLLELAVAHRTVGELHAQLTVDHGDVGHDAAHPRVGGPYEARLPTGGLRRCRTDNRTLVGVIP